MSTLVQLVSRCGPSALSLSLSSPKPHLLPPFLSPLTLIWHTDDKTHRGALSRFLSFFQGSPPFSSPALGPIITDMLSVVLIPDYLLPMTSGSRHRALGRCLSALLLSRHGYTWRSLKALPAPESKTLLILATSLS